MIPIRTLSRNLAAFAVILAFGTPAAAELCSPAQRQDPALAEECSKLDDAKAMLESLNRGVASLSRTVQSVKDYNAEQHRRNTEMLKQLERKN